MGAILVLHNGQCRLFLMSRSGFDSLCQNHLMIFTPEGFAVVENDSHLSKWVAEHKRLNVQQGYLELFRKYIPVGGTVLDIGACLGDHTWDYAHFVGPTGCVIAFEPNPVAYECCKYNMRPFNHVAVHNWAVGNKHGKVSIQQDNNLGASILKPGEDIMIFPLDDILVLERLDFIKIDAEGWESEILDGAKGLIQKFRPVMLIEINRHVLQGRGMDADKVAQQIRDMGYVVNPSEPHISMAMDQVDVLCLPI